MSSTPLNDRLNGIISLQRSTPLSDRLAGVAEQADAPDSSPGAARREGSIPSSRTSPVETLIRTTIEGLDLSSLDEDSFIRVFFEVLSEGEDRGLLKTGCDMHESSPFLTQEQEEMFEAGEDPCVPVVWVNP